MAGMKVQVVEVDKDGSIDVSHLKAMVCTKIQAFTMCINYHQEAFIFNLRAVYSDTLVCDNIISSVLMLCNSALQSSTDTFIYIALHTVNCFKTLQY